MEQSGSAKRAGISSAGLHILAMAFMLCDHLWATVLPGQEWLTCVGRLAFPIFAFLLVEGYFHTKSRKRYALRLLGAALLSEIPFNLLVSGSAFQPLRQNVIWTLLIGMGAIHLNQLARRRDKTWLTLLTAAATLAGGWMLGTLTGCDYHGAGVVTVLTFYLLRGPGWYRGAMQLAALWYINGEMLGGPEYLLPLGSHTLHLPRQLFALAALPFLRLYRGEKGLSAPRFSRFCYAFYPAHMLLLALLALLT